MQQSFSEVWAIGLILAVVLVYLILMAQFASFSDPFIILLAVPPGFILECSYFLLLTGTTHERHVAHGSSDYDDRHRGIGQYFDCGVRRIFA